MKAEEYLKQSGYNENYSIGAKQICRLMEGYAKHQLQAEREISRQLWKTWEFLAEAGEIHIGQKWSKKYDELKPHFETSNPK